MYSDLQDNKTWNNKILRSELDKDQKEFEDILKSKHACEQVEVTVKK